MLTHLLATVLLLILLFGPLRSGRALQLLREAAGAARISRRDFYRSAILSQWLLAVLALAAVSGPDGRLAALGVRLPQTTGDSTVLLGLISLAILSQSALLPPVRQWLERTPRARRHLWPLRDLLPRTPAEKALWIGVSVTAGICEELLFRGFLFYFLATYFGFGAYPAIVISAVVFGLGHAYQGAFNMLRICVIGALLGWTYHLSGSLLPAMLLHVLLDLGGLWLYRILVPIQPDTAG